MLTFELATGLGLVPLEAVRRVVRPPDPPAGTEVVIDVPGGVLWHVEVLAFRLVTSAAVATRSVNLEVTAEGAVAYSVIAATQAENTNVVHSFAPYGVRSVGSTRVAQPLPWPAWMDSRWQIASATGNLQAGDTYRDIVLVATEVQIRALERARGAFARALAEAGLLQEV